MPGQGLSGEGDDTDYVMMMLVDMEHEGLVVFPTHRLVRNLENLDLNRVVEACRQYFDVTSEQGVSTIGSGLDALYQKGEKAFALYAGGDDWTLLVLKDKEILPSLLPGKSAGQPGSGRHRPAYPGAGKALRHRR